MTPFRNSARLLELQVAIVAIAVGIVAVSSVMATERRMAKRLHAGLKPPPAAAAAAADAADVTPAVTPDDQPLADARD